MSQSDSRSGSRSTTSADSDSPVGTRQGGSDDPPAGESRGRVTLTVRDQVATISLDRPAQRNRLSRAMLDQLIGICDSVAENEAVRAVIVRGEGSDFSTGVDLADPELTEIARQPIGKRRRSLRFGPDSVDAIRSLPQPTIAAMHGYCLGGGGCLALACDLRIAAADLRFGMPEVRRGMNMSWRTVHLMVAHWGPARTKELLITGRELEMNDAVAWGLANRTSEAGADAVQMVSAILRNGPEHLRTVRDGVVQWMEEREYESLAQMQGGMDLRHCPDPIEFERGNYMRVLQGWRGFV